MEGGSSSSDTPHLGRRGSEDPPRENPEGPLPLDTHRPKASPWGVLLWLKSILKQRESNSGWTYCTMYSPPDGFLQQYSFRTLVLTYTLNQPTGRRHPTLPVTGSFRKVRYQLDERQLIPPLKPVSGMICKNLSKDQPTSPPSLSRSPSRIVGSGVVAVSPALAWRTPTVWSTRRSFTVGIQILFVRSDDGASESFDELRFTRRDRCAGRCVSG